MKLMRYNQPKINIVLGILVSIVQGSFMPFIGAIMAKMLFVLMEVTNLDQLRTDANKWCFVMLVISVSAILTGFCQKLSFGVIGENVAFNIRKTLYRKILEKHQGWFDQKENAPGILTGTLSSDAQIINGVSTEGLGSILEAICSVVIGIALGFYFSWRMAVLCICIAPFAGITGYMGVKRQKGLGDEVDSSMSKGNLLAGDSIMSYRTVASFAHEEKIVSDYQHLLEEPHAKVFKSAHFTGFIYGFSQFFIYGSIAALFYGGALFLRDYKEKPLEMFICIFAMNFGAMASGQANQFGPDVGKATTAAKKIFAIFDRPTQITAMHVE
jgi:ATP-binding cassette subfamily B (MDR/TAP) protein 1